MHVFTIALVLYLVLSNVTACSRTSSRAVPSSLRCTGRAAPASRAVDRHRTRWSREAEPWAGRGSSTAAGSCSAGFVDTVVLSVASIVTGDHPGPHRRAPPDGPCRARGAVLRVYLEVFRGSPAARPDAVHLLRRGVPGASVSSSVFTAALIALTLYEGALISEIFRAGIEAVPTGQREAARSLGLSRVQIERVRDPAPDGHDRPAAARRPVHRAGQGHGARHRRSATSSSFARVRRSSTGIGMPIEVFLVVSVIYFVICYPMSLFARRLELRTLHA